MSLTKNAHGLCLDEIPLKNHQRLFFFEKEAVKNPSSWVFPSATSASGHFMDPKKAWQRLLKKANLQDLRIHDLRRTLGSYITMNNTSLHIVGKTLGHHSSDATEVYARLQVETIRQASQGAIHLMHKNC